MSEKQADYTVLTEAIEACREISEARERLYHKAVAHFGTDRQVDKAAEEAAEFIQALLKHHREPSAKGLVNLAEEIADLEIMLKQIKIIFRCGNIVSESKCYKLARLGKTIREAGK